MKNPLANNYSESENIVLVDRILAGDREALAQLVTLHQPFIYNVAWKMTHSEEDAQDLSREVLIKVITKLDTFEKRARSARGSMSRRGSGYRRPMWKPLRTALRIPSWSIWVRGFILFKRITPTKLGKRFRSGMLRFRLTPCKNLGLNHERFLVTIQ